MVTDFSLSRRKRRTMRKGNFDATFVSGGCRLGFLSERAALSATRPEDHGPGQRSPRRSGQRPAGPAQFDQPGGQRPGHLLGSCARELTIPVTPLRRSPAISVPPAFGFLTAQPGIRSAGWTPSSSSAQRWATPPTTRSSAISGRWACGRGASNSYPGSWTQISGLDAEWVFAADDDRTHTRRSSSISGRPVSGTGTATALSGRSTPA